MIDKKYFESLLEILPDDLFKKDKPTAKEFFNLIRAHNCIITKVSIDTTELSSEERQNIHDYIFASNTKNGIMAEPFLLLICQLYCITIHHKWFDRTISYLYKGNPLYILYVETNGRYVFHNRRRKSI
jgi:hypothetical protein